jgi:hypothetical protein
MDYGWRSPEGAANNYPERQMPVASKADCMERADQQTSGIRDALPQFAMMISLQLTSSHRIINAPTRLCTSPTDELAQIARSADMVTGLLL